MPEISDSDFALFAKLKDESAKAQAELSKLKNDPQDKSKEEVTDLKKQVAKVEKRIEKGEIEGMSESTAHALLEELRALRSEIKGGDKPKETESAVKKESGFFASFFGDD